MPSRSHHVSRVKQGTSMISRLKRTPGSITLWPPAVFPWAKRTVPFSQLIATRSDMMSPCNPLSRIRRHKRNRPRQAIETDGLRLTRELTGVFQRISIARRDFIEPTLAVARLRQRHTVACSRSPNRQRPAQHGEVERRPPPLDDPAYDVEPVGNARQSSATRSGCRLNQGTHKLVSDRSASRTSRTFGVPSEANAVWAIVRCDGENPHGSP